MIDNPVWSATEYDCIFNFRQFSGTNFPSISHNSSQTLYPIARTWGKWIWAIENWTLKKTEMIFFHLVFTFCTAVDRSRKLSVFLRWFLLQCGRWQWDFNFRVFYKWTDPNSKDFGEKCLRFRWFWNFCIRFAKISREWVRDEVTFWEESKR